MGKWVTSQEVLEAAHPGQRARFDRLVPEFADVYASMKPCTTEYRFVHPYWTDMQRQLEEVLLSEPPWDFLTAKPILASVFVNGVGWVPPRI